MPSNSLAFVQPSTAWLPQQSLGTSQAAHPSSHHGAADAVRGWSNPAESRRQHKSQWSQESAWRAGAASAVAAGVFSMRQSKRRTARMPAGSKSAIARRAAAPMGGEPDFPVLEGLRRKGSDLPGAPGESGQENFEPIAEFRAIRDNTVGSWGFLDDEEFAIRIVTVFGGAFVPGLAFMSAVFPFTDTAGGLALKNVVADFFFAAFISSVAVLGVLLYMAQQWSTVDKALRKEKYTVEYDPTAKMDYTSGPGGAYSYQQVKSQKAVQRDRLIAEYDVEPALNRLRTFLAASVVAVLVMPAVGSSMGAEMKLAPPEEEEVPKLGDTGRLWRLTQLGR
eukprot:TRINITY_DN29633_c0_g2_i1.p1 TRINITY_DN29633_c0_g2~~TRINITY_DN29633_c0_g2_i1.p1  ORF type:complete len:336 (-),score=86.40 TRINITY_DN29633_c0_g2_i1:276-1283(-)